MDKGVTLRNVCFSLPPFAPKYECGVRCACFVVIVAVVAVVVVLGVCSKGENYYLGGLLS